MLTAKQVKFGNLIAQGTPPQEAYDKAYGAKNGQSAASCASRTLKNANLQTYIRQIRMEAATDTLLTIAEKRQYLADLLRLPTDKMVNAQNGNVEIPEGVGRFIQGIDVQEKINADGDTWGFVKRIKLADKLKAMELDNKLAGHDAPTKLEVEAGPSLLEWVRQRNGQAE